MYATQSARQANAFAAVERTGLSKSDIGRIAGVHRSQVSRWVSGEQRPSYERAMRLAGHLRTAHPELAAELIAATGYGVPSDQAETDVLAEEFGPERADRLRREFARRGEKGAEALRALLEVLSPPAAAQPEDESPPSRAAG